MFNFTKNSHQGNPQKDYSAVIFADLLSSKENFMMFVPAPDTGEELGDLRDCTDPEHRRTGLFPDSRSGQNKFQRTWSQR